MSHEAVEAPGANEARTIKAKVFDIMERITGHHPPTCPWRVMYSPLVREVLAAMDHDGELTVAIGVDPPGILVDAIAEFKRSLKATQNEDAKLAHEAAMKRARK